MRKKVRGFTILELIITLSLTVIVLGVVYTFFLSNSKTLAKTEINSDLQLEAEGIQKELLLYGTQAKEIVKINDVIITNSNKYNYDGVLDSDGKLDITDLRLKVGDEYFAFIYNASEKLLTLNKVRGDGLGSSSSDLNLLKELSKNVTDFKIRPLDYRMNPNGNFKDATALEISLILNKKKGYSDVTIPVSTIVKLRNK